MELSTIVGLSASLYGLCKNVSGEITNLIEQVKKEDTTLGELRLQIDALSQIFHAIGVPPDQSQPPRNPARRRPMTTGGQRRISSQRESER